MTKAISELLAKTKLLNISENVVDGFGRQLRAEELERVVGGAKPPEGTTSMINGVPVDCLD